MSVTENGNNSTKIYGIASKVNQLIFTLLCNFMPNIKILTKAGLQISCSQGWCYIYSGKRDITPARPAKGKNTGHMPHINFQDSSISGS